MVAMVINTDQESPPRIRAPNVSSRLVRGVGMSAKNRVSFDLPFARSFVLNHRGDDTRWNSFIYDNYLWQHTQRLTRVPVIDPVHVTPPRHWRGSLYQWARLRGVLAVLETCLDKRIACAMI